MLTRRFMILLLTAAFSFVGCATSKAGRARTEAAKAEKNKQVARRFFTEILNEGRFEVAQELYAPDFRNGRFSAEDDIEAARGWRQAFPDLRFDVEILVSEGDYVSVFWRLRGTNTGAADGLPATGRTVDTRGVTIWKVIDARLKEEWTVMNEASARRQLGLGCEPPMF